MIVTVVLPDLKNCIIHSIQPLAMACALVNSLKCHSHKPVYTIHSHCWAYILTPSHICYVISWETLQSRALTLLTPLYCS